EEGGPRAVRLGAPRADAGREALVHAVGDEELGVLRPAIGALGQLHLVVAEGLSVGFLGVLLVGRTVADVAVEDDEGGPPRGAAEDVEGLLDAAGVVGVAHAEDVPSVALEAGRGVLRGGVFRVPLAGDGVHVVHAAERVGGEVAGDRGRLRGDAFHHAAVAATRVDLVVENIEVGAVVAIGQPLLRDGHAHAGGYALPQRAGGRLHAGDEVVLGVSRRLAVDLAGAPGGVERHRGASQPVGLG